MMTSHILKSVDFTKTQKSRYLENETFFLQIKKFINNTSRANSLQKIVLWCRQPLDFHKRSTYNTTLTNYDSI